MDVREAVKEPPGAAPDHWEGAVLLLCSDLGQYITGQVFGVNGGLLMD